MVRAEGEIGLALAGQRRRHADRHHVALAEPGEVGSGLEATGADQPSEFAAAHGVDIGFATIEPFGLLRIDVEAEGAKAGARRRRGQRQADVAEADHADAGAAVVQAPGQRVDEASRGRGHAGRR
jgi:hypothetical protein